MFKFFQKQKDAKVIPKPSKDNFLVSYELSSDGRIDIKLEVPDVDYDNLTDEELSTLIGTYSIFLYSIGGLDVVSTVLMRKIEEKLPPAIAEAVLDSWLHLAAFHQAQQDSADGEEAPLVSPSEVFKH